MKVSIKSLFLLVLIGCAHKEVEPTVKKPEPCKEIAYRITKPDKSRPPTELENVLREFEKGVFSCPHPTHRLSIEEDFLICRCT